MDLFIIGQQALLDQERKKKKSKHQENGENVPTVIDPFGGEHTGTLTLRALNCDFIDYHFCLVYAAGGCRSV